ERAIRRRFVQQQRASLHLSPCKQISVGLLEERRVFRGARVGESGDGNLLVGNDECTVRALHVAYAVAHQLNELMVVLLVGGAARVEKQREVPVAKRQVLA